VVEWRVVRKKGRVQNGGLLQEQGRLLLVGQKQGLERAPLQHPKRTLLQNPLQAPERLPLRLQDRRLLREPGRVLFRML
jgi:hypothetical protein